MYYSKLNKYDIANGSGVRVSLFISGCRNYCEGCFNRESWSFTNGKPLTVDVLDEIVEAINQPNISGFSLLGGEPMDTLNQSDTLDLLSYIKSKICEANKDIWMWTGYKLYDELLNHNSTVYTSYTDEILNLVDYIVDGRFEKDKYDYRLVYRGSMNQHIYYNFNSSEYPLRFSDVSNQFVKW